MTRSRRRALIVAAVAAIAALLAGCGGSSSSSSSASSSSSELGGSSGRAARPTSRRSRSARRCRCPGDFASDGQAFEKGYTAVGRRHQQGRRPDGPPGQARHRLRRVEPGAGRDQLPEADLLRPRPARVRPVLDAADRAVLEGRQPLRVRVRRGRRRRAGGVRQRPEEHLRRQPAGDRQPHPVRARGSRRCPPRERPKTAAVATSDDPFTQPQIPAASKILQNAGIKIVYNKVFPAEVTDYTPIATAVASTQGRGVPAGLGRRADGVGVHPHVHPAALQPQGVHRDRRSGPGRRVPEGDRRQRRTPRA